MPLSIKAVLFDMDGTLGDTLAFIVQALQETLQRFAGIHYSSEEIIGMFGPTEEGVIYPRVPQAAGEEAVQYYLERYASLHHHAPDPFPGVIELLRDLRAHGIKTGVVTGKGPRSTAISMEVYGLAPYLDGLESGSHNGGEKHLAIRKLLTAWGVSPKDAAYVGDMPSDLEAARLAGVVPIGAAWASSNTLSPGDGLIFHSVAEFRHWSGLD